MKTIAISLQEDQKLLPISSTSVSKHHSSRNNERSNLRIVKDEEVEATNAKASAEKKPDDNPFASWIMPPQQKGYMKGDDRNLLL